MSTYDTLKQATLNKLKETASNLFGATPVGQLYNSVKTAPQELNKPVPKFLATTPSGTYTPKTVGQYIFGSEGNLPTLRETENFAVNYALPALPPFSSPFLFKPNIKSVATAFTFGAGLEGARQYGEGEKFDFGKILTTGAQAAPFGLLTTPEMIKNKPVLNETKLPTMDAKTRLKSLLTYDRDLERMGYSAKERANISAVDARKIFDSELPSQWTGRRGGDAQRRAEALTHEAMNESNAGWFTSLMYPLKTLSKDLQSAVIRHDNMIKLAKVNANKAAQDFRTKLAPDLEWKLVQYSQDPQPSVAKSLGLTIDDLKAGESIIRKSQQFNDQLYKDARLAGIELGYLKNHIYQAFKENEGQIDEAIRVRGLSKRPGFAQHRQIPTYQYAMEKLGLTPRFTTFAQANASARYALDKAISNARLAEKLISSGQLLPSSKAPSNWVRINAKFFPKANVRIGVNLNNSESYSAPQNLAGFLTTYFGTGEQSIASKILQTTGELSAKAQDIRLSSGGQTINSFTIGQLFKDFATATGDIATGKFKRGYDTGTASLKALFRGFIPNASQKFEEAHAESISEMASHGHAYTGLFDYETAFPNVVERKSVVADIKSKGGNLWNALINEPTFKKFLYQRKVSLYEGFRDALVRGGKEYDDAQRIAAEQLRNYDGQTISLGRSPDVQNIMKTFFLAPSYRETVLGSGFNAIKGLVDFKNEAYSPSRSLLLGLIGTYLAYDALNKKNTGRHMYENPSGRTFEVMFNDPNDKNKYYSVPWMPSSTATYRRIGEGLVALMRGDMQEAVKQFSSLGSIPVSLGGELVSGKDYFGRDIFPNGNPTVLDYGKRIVTGLMPTPLDTASKTYDAYKAGKNPNLGVATAQMFELPIKQGTYSSQFYSIRDSVLKDADKQVVEVYKQLHPDRKDENRTREDSMQDAMTRLSNFSVVALEGQIDKATAQKLGRPSNPFYELSPQQQKVVLWTQALPYGSDKSALQKANIEWLKPYWDARSNYFAQIGSTNEASTAPVASARAQQIMDAGNFKDPEVRAYLDANTAYKNKVRESMGLTPLATNSYGGGVRSLKPRAPSIKVPTLKKISMKKVKLAKFKKYKVPKLKTIARMKYPKFKYTA